MRATYLLFAVCLLFLWLANISVAFSSSAGAFAQFCRKSVGIYISFITKQTRDLSCSEEDASVIFFLSINSDKNKEDRSAVLTQQQ